MMLADNLSIIQCHILFDDDRGKSRLEHQKSWKGIPSFGKIFEDCDFFVNYKTKTFLEEMLHPARGLQILPYLFLFLLPIPKFLPQKAGH